MPITLFPRPYRPKTTTLGPRPALDDMVRFLQDCGEEEVRQHIAAQSDEDQYNLRHLFYQANLILRGRRGEGLVSTALTPTPPVESLADHRAARQATSTPERA
jgi:hypothetical protein